MRIGPFGQPDLETIEALFKRHQVEYEMIVRRPTAQSTGRRGGRRAFYLQKPYWYEIKDEDYPRLADELANYGVVAPADGRFELGEEE